MPYGATIPTYSTANLTNSSATQVLAANLDRRYAHFANLSTGAVIWLNGSSNAAVGLGIPLTPASVAGGIGGTYEMTVEKHNLVTGAITGIASATTSAGLAILVSS